MSPSEAERWLAIADELNGQAARLKATDQLHTKADWEALAAIESAARCLFSAFASVMREWEVVR